MSESIRAPEPAGLPGEARVFLEFPKPMLPFPGLAKQPRGSGERSMVLPGYGDLLAYGFRRRLTGVHRSALSPSRSHRSRNNHLGLGFSPEVFQIIAKRLAREGVA